jgi:hypothetical protein
MSKMSEEDKKQKLIILQRKKFRPFSMIFMVFFVVPIAVIAGISYLLAGKQFLLKGLGWTIIPLAAGVITVFLAIRELRAIKKEKNEILNTKVKKRR